jgi:hypothetical protein
LKRGCIYAIRLHHAGTDPAYEDDPNPDGDYELEIVNLPPGAVLDDPYGLFGSYNDDNGAFTGAGKTAWLRVPDENGYVPEYGEDEDPPYRPGEGGGPEIATLPKLYVTFDRSAESVTGIGAAANEAYPAVLRIRTSDSLPARVKVTTTGLENLIDISTGAAPAIGQNWLDAPMDISFSCTGRVSGVARVTAELRSDGREAATTRAAALYVLGEPRLVFDYDRDGKIDAADAAMARDGHTVFRFWVNDDSDRDGMNENDSEHDRPGQGSNHADDRVNGRCDLLDFTPVWIDTSEVFPAGTPLRFRDRTAWFIESTNVNVVLTSLCKNEANKFLLTESQNYGHGLDKTILNARTQHLFERFLLPRRFTNIMLNEDGKGVFLMECHSAGTQLRISAWRPLRYVARASANVQFSSVTNMYWYHSLRGAEQTDNFQIPASTMPSNLMTDRPKDLDVFFTHGFRVPDEDARAWGSELFKRFWQSGSNARFHMVTWNGNHGTPSFAYYHQDVYNALCTGMAFRQLIEQNQIVPSKRIVMAQSLGNMMVCEALLNGLSVEKYFMFNAAVATEAIDNTLQCHNVPSEIATKYVPSAWHNYNPLTWAANWFRWFTNPDDARGKMGWPGRYENAIENARERYNYYSSGDCVFKESSTLPLLTSGIFHLPKFSFPWPIVRDWNLTGEMFCWQKQETHKGIEFVAGSVTGGWRFHTWEEYPLFSDIPLTLKVESTLANEMVTRGEIAKNPIFETFGTTLRKANATREEVYMALAKHVPAVSSPLGGTPVAKIQSFNLDNPQYRSSWGRRSNHKYRTEWQHSDMKDMAFSYVTPLYRELVTKGDLK